MSKSKYSVLDNIPSGLNIIHKQWMELVMKYIWLTIILFVLPEVCFAGDFITEKQVNSFMSDWLTAQNTGSYSIYSNLYANNFSGIRRSGSKTIYFNHDTWLKDRKSMFNKRFIISMSNTKLHISGNAATVRFTQCWENDTYKDIGDKVIVLLHNNGSIKIVYEGMLSSNIVFDNSSHKVINSFAIKQNNLRLNSNHTSYFTSINRIDCSSKLSSSLSAFFNKRGVTALKCQAPKDWQLFVVSSGERSWIDIAHGQSIWSTEKEVVYDNNFGHFPNLGAERVEWRLKPDGTPVSLIFRVTAQDPNAGVSGGNLSRLYIIGLTGGIPKFCGVVKTNEDARMKGDFPQYCTELPEQP